MLDPGKEGIGDFCIKMADGLGVQVAFHCAGVQSAFDAALTSARGKGKIVQVANYENPLTIKTPNLITRRQITIVGSNTYDRQEFQEFIDGIASGV